MAEKREWLKTITTNEIKAVINKLSANKSQGLESFKGELYQTF